MATLEDRPFSKNYSGLINQSVIAAGLFVICIASHDLMKRKRRGEYKEGELGSVESWQFGYLYQARSWARKATPPIAQGWPLSWVKQTLRTPDHEMNRLRGTDATLYVRFLHGCVYFTLAHTLTTFPILLPIHVTFADENVSPKSMTRASISSLVGTAEGPKLLWIHLILLIWLTTSWMYTLHWIIRGAFRYRTQNIQRAAKRIMKESEMEGSPVYHPHPHPQYPFYALPPSPLDYDKANRGTRARTIMVTNIPPSLRSERDLKEYFEYYMSKPIAKPTIGVTSSAQPGFVDRMVGYVFNRTMRLVSRMHKSSSDNVSPDTPPPSTDGSSPKPQVPVIEKVALVRKMTELASLLERREDVLKNLEAAHVKFACNALEAVAAHLEPKSSADRIREAMSTVSFGLTPRAPQGVMTDLERGAESNEGTADGTEGEDRMHLLVRTLAPFLPTAKSNPPQPSLWSRWTMDSRSADIHSAVPLSQKSPQLTNSGDHETVWDALLSLPRSTLDAYQPLIHLSALFRGKTVPSIDYHTAKLNLLTALITEQRAQPPSEFPPVSTAFVTFADPTDARRACKYLAVHPSNPVNVCLVTMAPSYEDLDWTRLMKSTFRGEFVKDWVVNLGVWGFTIFWVFPVTSIVAFVSIQTISAYWPGLKRYLDKHEWQSEVLQSLVPTLLVALLALLVPLILLLIAKKAHTISTLSALHDRIMTRYYKFLIVNVLFFFCVGTVTLQTVLFFKATLGQQLIEAVAESFPTGAPFYVGWLIFTTAVHGCLELALFGLPLFLYPGTQRQVTPRKREVGIRPRTFNYYYWLPSHLLIVHILLLFAVLNPLVVPFGLVYFCVEAVVVKHQLLHVYAKNYEGNGQVILIRLLRYSLDGLVLGQAVFLAYMVVLKMKANVGVAAVLIILTVFTKLSLTRFCRARFERDDVLEAKILSGMSVDISVLDADNAKSLKTHEDTQLVHEASQTSTMSGLGFFTWKLASRVGLNYGTITRRHHKNTRQPIPFSPRSSGDSAVPLHAYSSTAGLLGRDLADPEQDLRMLPNQPIVEEPADIPEYDRDRLSLVVPHPPLPAWDDESNPDLPYDNPYYTKQISETLWLPRNPMGLLNMDDTVDMRISLTSDASAGKLGVWQDDEFIGSNLSSVFARSFGSVDEFNDDEAQSSSSPSRQLTGSEMIELPSVIADRVEHIEHERGVETVSRRRPSFLASRKQSTASTGQRIALRRSTMDAGFRPGFRSFSLGTSEMDLSLPQPSLLTVPSRHGRQRSASVDMAGIQRPVRSRTTTPARSPVRSASRSLAPSSAITTREAVVGEALAEEQEAAQERQRQELIEEEKAREPRSWLTSWMFSKAH